MPFRIEDINLGQNDPKRVVAKLRVWAKALRCLLNLRGDGDGGYIGIHASTSGFNLSFNEAKMLSRIPHPSVGEIFCVHLTQDGGSDGNGTSVCSWTYTVKDQNGNTLNDPAGAAMTGVSPTHNRSKFKTLPATRGTIWYRTTTGDSTTYELYQTDEYPNFGLCT